MKRTLGNLERQLFAYAQTRSLSLLRSGQLTGPLGISGNQERELLTRLRISVWHLFGSAGLGLEEVIDEDLQLTLDGQLAGFGAKSWV